MSDKKKKQIRLSDPPTPGTLECVVSKATLKNWRKQEIRAQSRIEFLEWDLPRTRLQQGCYEHVLDLSTRAATLEEFRVELKRLISECEQKINKQEFDLKHMKKAM